MDSEDQVTFMVEVETLQQVRDLAAKRLAQYGGSDAQWNTSTAATPLTRAIDGQVVDWEVEVTAVRFRRLAR